MKYIFASALGVLLSLSVTSCKNEEVKAPQAPSEQLAQDERFVEINLSSILDDEADRARFSYYDRDFYSLSGGDKIYPIMEEKNLKILVVARQDGGRTIYNTLEFKKVANQRKVIYQGRIKVPNTNQNQVELAAIVLSEVGGREFVRFDETSKKARVIPTQRITTATDGVISTSVPYLARWTPITVLDDATSASGTRLAQSATLRFKPSGSLLRFEFSYQKDGGAGSITLIELEARTNAFYLNWEYDFEKLGNAPSMEDNTLADGQPLDNTTLNREFHFPLDYTIQANGTTTPGFFLWVMPRSQADRLDPDLRTDFILHTSDGIGGVRERRRISTRFLPITGGSNNINLKAHKGNPITD